MRFFRQGLKAAGFELLAGDHPIIPVMLHDARRAALLAEALLAKGIYVIAFSYPVVPKGKARIRTQISASHTREELERAVQAFAEAAAEIKEAA
jgi:glycine C-acetyltransferase